MGCVDPIPEQSAWGWGFPLGRSVVRRLSLWAVGRLASPGGGERGTVTEEAAQARSQGPPGPTSLRTPGLRWLRGGQRGWLLKVRAKVSAGGAQL